MSPTTCASATRLGQALRQQSLTLAVAESCTGGGISQAITDIPGSSGWFDRGFVTYSNAAKNEMLGVPVDTLNQYGAVSPETALAMAAGALRFSLADLAIAVTGIAGPDGGSPEKPVGTVFIALQKRGEQGVCFHQQLTGDRRSIRQQVIAFCLTQATLILETGIGS